MTNPNSESCIEKSEELAAYLDGELDGRARSEVERHLEGCAACKARLREQQRLLCALDLALNDDPALRLPGNFSRVVAAHARADMSGLRERAEHGRALRLCVALLSAASLLLLAGGAAFGETVLLPAITVGKYLVSLLDFLWQVLRGAGTGVSIILRALSRHLVFTSNPLGLLLALLLFVSATLLFARLLAGYHRKLSMNEDGA